jgi:hypothetical protein
MLGRWTAGAVAGGGSVAGGPSNGASQSGVAGHDRYPREALAPGHLALAIEFVPERSSGPCQPG